MVTVQRLDSAGALARIGEISDLYAEVYAESPYREGPEDVADFREGFPRRASQPGFACRIAAEEGKAVGFAFGHTLGADTRWWDGMLDEVPPELVAETGHRSFAVIELAVLAGYRRRGIGRSLFDALLAGRPEERAALLVRPEADAAQAAYTRWGWQRIGRLRPYADAPAYDAMVLPLDQQSTASRAD